MLAIVRDNGERIEICKLELAVLILIVTQGGLNILYRKVDRSYMKIRIMDILSGLMRKGLIEMSGIAHVELYDDVHIAVINHLKATLLNGEGSR